ncbi:hypothetical protein EXE43_01630 [Halorubrum sp. SS5]|uniref:Uncharacterized protein n=1 Tax=Halorubrum salinarum TaxID=2739057 RepID=A0A7D4C7I8_9EURY|nr:MULTISPECIES: hypothetical protein [Halorubrum]QKG94218.1 hypothetical protein HPS36_15055 [Halorubrum salinarum]TKX57095.1 hypothetical protein EXE44_11830 [Halorubrum sp. SS7]TKX87686.1 hypothetical protein EXE43_01630 [Halorubrum sp. SS5]
MRLAIGRRDSAAVVAAVTVGYLLAYLWATGDLSLRTGVAPGVLVIDDPLGRLFARTGPASFGAIATVDTGIVRLLLSPVNVAIGAIVAGLVGINLGMTYLAVRRPTACGIGAGSGLLASVPALLSGTVCCGPVVLLAIGVQATAVVLTAFVWLLPIGVALLLASLAYVATKIDPGRPIES